ncbi:hypothetical protein [Euzebyella saccharophila]|uniref:Lipoprotein n=1 Tax=Euzebyella saccharophila TaxID=679664 RepID=A0ABV8JX44_9FLAO|nr:hypothetical protein [Euzebyella saccharophila]
MIKYLFIIPLLFLSFCESDEVDCSTTVCEGGISELLFQLRDSTTKENVLTNEILTLEDITLEGSNSAQLSIENIIETDMLVLRDSNWKEDMFSYQLIIKDSIIYDLDLELNRTPNGGCCGGILKTNSLKINDETKEIQEIYNGSILLLP